MNYYQRKVFGFQPQIVAPNNSPTNTIKHNNTHNTHKSPFSFNSSDNGNSGISVNTVNTVSPTGGKYCSSIDMIPDFRSSSPRTPWNSPTPHNQQNSNLNSNLISNLNLNSNFLTGFSSHSTHSQSPSNTHSHSPHSPHNNTHNNTHSHSPHNTHNNAHTPPHPHTSSLYHNLLFSPTTLNWGQLGPSRQTLVPPRALNYYQNKFQFTNSNSVEIKCSKHENTENNDSVENVNLDNKNEIKEENKKKNENKNKNLDNEDNNIKTIMKEDTNDKNEGKFFEETEIENGIENENENDNNNEDGNEIVHNIKSDMEHIVDWSTEDTIMSMGKKYLS